MTLLEQMYNALKIAGNCTCEYERDKAGVPVWVIPKGGGPVERNLLKRCSTCNAIARYERELGKVDVMAADGVDSDPLHPPTPP